MSLVVAPPRNPCAVTPKSSTNSVSRGSRGVSWHDVPMDSYSTTRSRHSLAWRWNARIVAPLAVGPATCTLAAWGDWAPIAMTTATSASAGPLRMARQGIYECGGQLAHVPLPSQYGAFWLAPQEHSAARVSRSPAT